MSQINPDELSVLYGTRRVNKVDVERAVSLTKSLVDNKDFVRVDKALSDILNMCPDYGINSRKNKATSWQNLLLNIDISTLRAIRMWLRKFTLEVAISQNFKEIHLKQDISGIVLNFKKSSLQLYKQGYIKVNPEVKFKREAYIVVSTRLVPLLRHIGGSYNVDDHLVELYYPSFSDSKEFFEPFLFHELCHAYFQTFGESSFFHKFPHIVEGTTDLMCFKLLACIHEEDRILTHEEGSYYGYVQIIKLLCSKSKGSIKEEHFVWAAADSRWLKKLQISLNNLYAKDLKTRDVLTCIEKKLSKRPDIFTHDYSEISLQVLAQLRKELT